MANLITSVASIETSEYEIYLKPLLSEPQFEKLPISFSYGNMPKDVFFNTNMDKIMRGKGDCGWNFVGGTAFTKKTLTPIEVQAATEQCYTVLLKKLFGDKLPDGAMRGELPGEVIDFMLNQQTYAFNRDLLTLLFLGDTSENDSPQYYDLMNGVFKKLVAGAAAADGTVDYGAITSTNVNTTNFFTTMKAVYDSQPRALRNIPNADKVWLWTQALYDAYVDYLTTKTQVTAGTIQVGNITDGIAPNAFLGVPIVVLPIIDERLEADFQSGSPLAVENPYRCVLTWGPNHIVHMDGNGFKTSNIWYEKKDDLVYLTGSALIAYEYGYGDLNVVAGIA